MPMRISLSLVWVPKRDPLHNEVRLRRETKRDLEALPPVGQFIPLADDGRFPHRVEMISEGNGGPPELFVGSFYEINEGPEFRQELDRMGFEPSAAP